MNIIIVDLAETLSTFEKDRSLGVKNSLARVSQDKQKLIGVWSFQRHVTWILQSDWCLTISCGRTNPWLGLTPVLSFLTSEDGLRPSKRASGIKSPSSQWKAESEHLHLVSMGFSSRATLYYLHTHSGSSSYGQHSKYIWHAWVSGLGYCIECMYHTHLLPSVLAAYYCHSAGLARDT